MAKFNSKATLFLNLVWVFSLLLMISIAESRHLSIGIGKAKAKVPDCDAVYGAESGDTCTSVAQAFSLTAEFFLSINPNINCDDIFIGQWLCVDGTA